MAVTARQSPPRKDIAQLGIEEDANEALERRPDRSGGVAVAGEEALLERSVARERVMARHAEGHDVARTVEAVAKAGKDLTIARGVEARDEVGGRRPHRGEDTLQLTAEEIDPAIREARREQGNHFAVARIGIPEGESDGVALDSRGVIEVAVELLERFA